MRYLDMLKVKIEVSHYDVTSRVKVLEIKIKVT